MRVLILIAAISLSAFSQADTSKFLTSYSSFFHWIGQEKTLTDTSDIKISSLEDYDKLAQYALYDYLVVKKKWDVSQIMSFDQNGNRVAASKAFIQVDQSGTKKHMVFNGYYFIKKMINGVEVRAILYVYQDQYSKKSYIHLYHRDDEAKIARRVYDELASYQTTNNMYKGGVLDSKAAPYGGRIYKFLSNVDEYNNTWDDLILDQKLKNRTYFSTEGFVLNNEKLSSIGIAQKRGVVLWGPPGTGKSFVGQILISSMLKGELKGQSTMFIVSARHLSDITTVSQLFRLARTLSTSVIFMEDIDLLAIKSRNANSVQGSSYDKKILNEFLNAMDGVQGNQGVLVIGTTNRARDLDGALTRSGRLGVHIYFGIPNYEERKVFFERFAQKRTKWATDLTLEWLAGQTEGLSGADIIELIGIAKQDAFLMGDMSGDLINLNKEYFLAAIEKVKHDASDDQSSFSFARTEYVTKSYVESYNFLNSLF